MNLMFDQELFVYCTEEVHGWMWPWPTCLCCSGGIYLGECVLGRGLLVQRFLVNLAFIK